MQKSLIALVLGLGVCGCAVDSTEAFESNSEHLYVLNTNVWSNHSISICWETSGFAAEKSWIQTALQDTWDRYSDISFTGWSMCTSSGANLRIRLQNSQGYTIGLGSQLNNASNGVNLNLWGTDASPVVCSSGFSRRDCVISTAVHEIGHALGFAHEQNRPDRPSSCTQPSQGTNGNVTVGPWDIDSVMNYCNPVRNGRGQISPTDIRGTQQFYGAPGGIYYRAHVASLGWLSTVWDNEIAGTVAQSRQAEAVQIFVAGDRNYRVCYQAHATSLGWLPEVCDGAIAGTVGQSRRIEAIRIRLVGAPAGCNVVYQAHVASLGWLPAVSNNEIAGTIGQSRQLEAYRVALSGTCQ